MLAWLLTLAHADPPDDKAADDWGFQVTPDVTIDPGDDDPAMTDFVAEKLRKPAPTSHSHLYPEGKLPLSDDWPLHVISMNEHLVVVELPVLVAQDRVAFVTAHPHGIVLIGEWTSGPHHLTVRQEIRPRDVFAAGPTFAFLKAAVPNRKAADQVRVVVKTGELPAPPLPGDEIVAEPLPAPAPPRTRYAQTTVYSR